MKEKVLLAAIGAIICVMAALGFLLLPVGTQQNVITVGSKQAEGLALPTPKASILPSPTATKAQTVTITLTGAVIKPGKYTLPIGSTVMQAINAAGGWQLKANLLPFDLNRVLVDGEKIKIDEFTAAEWEWICELKIPSENGM